MVHVHTQCTGILLCKKIFYLAGVFVTPPPGGGGSYPLDRSFRSISFPRPKPAILVPRFICSFVIAEFAPQSPFHSPNLPFWPPQSWPIPRTSHIRWGQPPDFKKKS